MKYIPNLNAELSVLEYRFRNEYENSRLMIISTLDRTKMAYVKGHTRRDVPELGSQRPEVKLSNDEEHFNVGELYSYALDEIHTYMREHNDATHHKCEREEYTVFFNNSFRAGELIGKIEGAVGGSKAREVLCFLGAYFALTKESVDQPEVPNPKRTNPNYSKRTNPNWGLFS
ncbi:hypothetical protein MW722_001514 [Acinetobacter baumannii]|uniref:Uncharacterized protein n=2 Tax=Acinetobacter baumannii TaxID=470 RepID=A0AAN5WE01_ACIBA|nr:hypothetical protein [Acinetobacter baumannii]EMT94608.1 hypothetical protein ABNIH5_00335 [Acinetobacter baumannii ABNIH5]ETY66938.1 hypothetical protein X964_18500 [Acinetobacter baumannii MDR_MMC4]EXB15687.1 hypothetical protein J513_0409 [Acinetobacter baumannii 1397084]EYD11770.1 hypothetical protein J935_1568 [Acinetobacter baumannii 44362_2]EYU47081.1 hypothetical protein J616_04064 [Acinetobacter baumannii 1457504]KCW29286.1 hypothetical protein J474_3053 [Acinetobacter baumannii 6